MHLLLEEFKNFSQVILKYTIIMSHSKSQSWSRSLILGLESESKFFSAGVQIRVWSPQFSNSGVGVPQKSRTLHPWCPDQLTLRCVSSRLSCFRFVCSYDDCLAELFCCWETLLHDWPTAHLMRLCTACHVISSCCLVLVMCSCRLVCQGTYCWACLVWQLP